MENKIINKNLVLNFLYAIAVFFLFSSIVSILAYFIQQLALDSMYRDDISVIILSIVFFLASSSGLGLSIIMFFTDKLPRRIFFAAEVIIVAALLILFIIIVYNEFNLPLGTFFQQIMYLAVILGIHFYQDYVEKKNSGESDSRLEQNDKI